MNSLPTIHETGELLFYQTKDSLTLVEVHFEKRLKKLEQIKSKVSKARPLKKKKGDL
jgi:hypothetical protein